MDFLHIWCVMLGIWGLLLLLTARWDAVRKYVQDESLQPEELRVADERLARKAVGVLCTIFTYVSAIILFRRRS